MTTTDPRITSLEAELLAACGEAQRRFGYRPHAFLSMLGSYGALDTASRLLRPGQEPQSGLFRLWECGALHLSLEAIVLRPEYAPLFEPADLDEATRRLERLNFTLAWAR